MEGSPVRPNAKFNPFHDDYLSEIVRATASAGDCMKKPQRGSLKMQSCSAWEEESRTTLNFVNCLMMWADSIGCSV